MSFRSKLISQNHYKHLFTYQVNKTSVPVTFGNRPHDDMTIAEDSGGLLDLHPEQRNIIVGSKLYVGNLPFSVTTDDLKSHFSSHGEITDAIVLTDRETGRSRGFGFVTYSK